MKKELLFGILCGIAAPAIAQEASSPEILPEFYIMGISPDGRYMASFDGYPFTLVYDRQSDEEPIYYDSAIIGNGNAVALNGMVVGSTEDDCATIMFNGEVIYPESLDEYTLANLHGVTPDGSRICGLVNNPDGGDPDADVQMYRPMYVDLVDGVVGEPVFLPVPEKDFFGNVPQYCSAVWISNDGKTILGQVVDNTGLLIAPIVYSENESGEWSYVMPTEKLFNPENLPLPVYPGEFDKVEPEKGNYMTQEQMEAYNAALAAWIASGYQSEYPEVEDYMDADKYEEYSRLLAEYENAAAEYNDKLVDYFISRDAILDSSVIVIQNGQTMNAAGTMIACAAQFMDLSDQFNPKSYNVTYIFNLEDGTYKSIESQYDQIIPSQILADGAIMGSAPTNQSNPLPPLSYVLAAGAEDYLPLADYLAGVNPLNSSWMKENLTTEVEIGYDDMWNPVYGEVLMSGHALASEDMNVISGGVFAYMFDESQYPYTYMSYILDGNKLTGIADISADNSMVKALRGGQLLVNGTVEALKVYDLSGRQVFAANNVSGVVDTKLGNGLYVVTYVDAEGRNVASKVRF